MSYAPAISTDAVSSAKIAPRQSPLVARAGMDPSVIPSVSANPMHKQCIGSEKMSGVKTRQVCPKNMGKFAQPSVSAAVAFILEKYPHKPAENLKAATGISAETFRNWRDGTSSPKWEHTWALIRVFGLPFLAAVMSDNEEIVVAAMRLEVKRRRTDLAQRFAELEARENAL